MGRADTLTSMIFPARRTINGEVPGRHVETARRTAQHSLLLSAIVIALCWPLLVHGVPETSSDGVVHAAWDRSFSNQLAAGELYPRWLSEDFGGLGSPVFFYYPPIPSYASSAFRFIFGARDPDGWLETGYGCFLAVLLSAIGACFWLRSHASGQAAMVGAAIYVIAPYHVAVDLYMRGATAELWSFAWLPLILLSVESLARRSKWGFPALAVTYALLAMTHLPTVLCFSPVVLAAGFFLAQPNRRLASAARAIGAMALGTGLAAIYLVPAMFDKWKINIGHLVSADYDFRDQWFFRPIAWGLDFPELLAILNITMFAFVGLLLWIYLRDRAGRYARRVAIFYAGVTVFAFVFMSQLSYPVWSLIPYLQFVQFPWRFSVLPPLAAAILSTLSFSHLKSGRHRFVPVAVGVLIFGWLGMTVWAERPVIAAMRGNPDAAAIQAKRDVKFRPGTCEYLPMSAGAVETCSDKASERIDMTQDLLRGHSPRTAFFPAGSADEVSGTAAVLDWKPRKVFLDVDAPVAGPLTLRHFYCAGWSARIADTGEAIAIGPSHPDGLMQVIVPEGRHEIAVELGTQPSEKTGRLISLASLACLVAILMFAKLRSAAPLLPD
jgi:hypothetical protein